MDPEPIEAVQRKRLEPGIEIQVKAAALSALSEVVKAIMRSVVVVGGTVTDTDPEDVPGMCSSTRLHGSDGFDGFTACAA